MMRIAIPLAAGKLAMHFGHSDQFALVDIDEKEPTTYARNDIAAPPHEPGMLPPWLAEKGVTHIIAGGMGQRAQVLFAQQGIRVIIGAPVGTPEELVDTLLAGSLMSGPNPCDSEHHGDHECQH